MSKKVKVDLTIEKDGQKQLWGRVDYNDNLISDCANSVPELEEKMKELLHEFEDVDPETIEFTHSYDVYSLFQKFDYLKITTVAKYAEMNAALLRQYASGIKNPSTDQAKKIEDTLHKLADEMREASVLG